MINIRRGLSIVATLVVFGAIPPESKAQVSACQQCGTELAQGNSRCELEYTECSDFHSVFVGIPIGIGFGAICTPVGGIPGALICGLGSAIAATVFTNYVTVNQCSVARLECRGGAQARWVSCVGLHCYY